MSEQALYQKKTRFYNKALDNLQSELELLLKFAKENNLIEHEMINAYIAEIKRSIRYYQKNNADLISLAYEYQLKQLQNL